MFVHAGGCERIKAAVAAAHTAKPGCSSLVPLIGLRLLGYKLVKTRLLRVVRVADGLTEATIQLGAVENHLS